MNRSFNFITIDDIINKVYKNPLLKDVNPEDIIDTTVSLIKLLKLKDTYKRDHCILEVKEGKAKLPKPALNMISVDFMYGDRKIPMVMSTSTYNNKNVKDLGRYTYGINNRIITTSFREGKIYVTFDTFMIDEDNHPMIPDSEAFQKALLFRIKADAYAVLFDLGKLPEASLRRAEQDYYFYVGKTQEEFQSFANDDNMAAFANDWTSWFQKDNNHADRDGSRSIDRRLNIN